MLVWELVHRLMMDHKHRLVRELVHRLMMEHKHRLVRELMYTHNKVLSLIHI